MALAVCISLILGLMGAAAMLASRRASEPAPDDPMALPVRLGWILAWACAWGSSLYLLAGSSGWLKAIFVWLAIISLTGGIAVFFSGWRTRR